MAFQHKVGFKLILIYLFSLVLALSAVLVVAESIITQQVHRRHQKRLDVLTEKNLFQSGKTKGPDPVIGHGHRQFRPNGPIGCQRRQEEYPDLGLFGF